MPYRLVGRCKEFYLISTRLKIITVKKSKEKKYNNSRKHLKCGLNLKLHNVGGR